MDVNKEPMTEAPRTVDIINELTAKLKVATDVLDKALQLLMWHVGSDEFKGYKHPDQAKHMREIEQALKEINNVLE